VKTTAIALLLVAVISIACADDFKTVNGKEYKRAEVLRVEPDGIVIKYASGIVKIPFTDLSAEQREKYHYKPEAAKEFTDAQRRNDAVGHFQTTTAQEAPRFKIEFLRGYDIYKVNYESAETMHEQQQHISDGLLENDGEAARRQSRIPAGGRLTIIIESRFGPESAKSSNETAIVFDDGGNEIIRKRGDDNFPTPSVKGWISAILVDLPKPITAFFVVRIVNNHSGNFSEYRITRD
jgi:hypothetical protein